MASIENAMKSVQEKRQANEQKNQEKYLVDEIPKNVKLSKHKSLVHQLTIGKAKLESEDQQDYQEVHDQN